MVGLTFNAIPFVLFAWAQTQISSILAGIWNATTPLWTVVMGLLLVPGVRPTRAVVGGLALGFFGVVVVLGPWSVGTEGCIQHRVPARDRSLLGSHRFLWIRRDVHGQAPHGPGRAKSPAQYPAAQLLVATAALSLVVVPAGRCPHRAPGSVVLAMLALGVLGTGLAYVLLYRVVALAGATTASTVTYLIPLVSTTLGIAVLGESLTWNEPLGAALVLAGAWLTRPRGASGLAAPKPPRRGPPPG